jgi:hypothetical protein
MNKTKSLNRFWSSNNNKKSEKKINKIKSKLKIIFHKTTGNNNSNQSETQWLEMKITSLKVDFVCVCVCR